MKSHTNHSNYRVIAPNSQKHSRPLHRGPFALLASLVAMVAILSLSGCTGHTSAAGTQPTTPSTAGPSVSAVGLLASSMSISFGTVSKGNTATQSLSITNTGAAA